MFIGHLGCETEMPSRCGNNIADATKTPGSKTPKGTHYGNRRS